MPLTPSLDTGFNSSLKILSRHSAYDGSVGGVVKESGVNVSPLDWDTAHISYISQASSLASAKVFEIGDAYRCQGETKSGLLCESYSDISKEGPFWHLTANFKGKETLGSFVEVWTAQLQSRDLTPSDVGVSTTYIPVSDGNATAVRLHELTWVGRFVTFTKGSRPSALTSPAKPSSGLPTWSPGSLPTSLGRTVCNVQVTGSSDWVPDGGDYTELKIGGVELYKWVTQLIELKRWTD